MNKKIIFIILSIAFFLGLFVLYFHFTSSIPYTSDNANAVIEDKALLSGNFLLKGWTIPIDNMLTTDTVFMIPIIFVRGGIFAMKFFPTLVFFILLLLSLLTAGLYKKGKEKYLAICITFLAIAFPSAIMLGLLLNGPNHLGTMVLVFLSIFAALSIAKNEHMVIWFFVLFFATFLANFSDPLFLIMGAIPIILISIFHMYKETWDEKKIDIAIIITIIAGIFLSTEARQIISNIGGVIFAPQPFIFTDIPGLLNNLFLMIKIILTMFAADFTNLALGLPNTNYVLVHVSFVLVLAGALIFFRKKYLHTIEHLSRLDELLCASILLDFGAVLVSRFPIDIGSTRYMYPIFFFGSILAARIISTYAAKIKTLYLYLGIITIFFIIDMQSIYASSIYAVSPRVAVEKYLLAHNLTRGYSNYWDASITTVETNEKIHVSGVLYKKRYLYSYKWSSEYQYYHGTIHFVMYSTPNIAKYAINTFGKPDQTVHIKGYTIMIWKKNISPLLRN
jgi:hypothetical protein